MGRRQDAWDPDPDATATAGGGRWRGITVSDVYGVEDIARPRGEACGTQAAKKNSTLFCAVHRHRTAADKTRNHLYTARHHVALGLPP